MGWRARRWSEGDEKREHDSRNWGCFQWQYIIAGGTRKHPKAPRVACGTTNTGALRRPKTTQNRFLLNTSDKSGDEVSCLKGTKIGFDDGEPDEPECEEEG